MLQINKIERLRKEKNLTQLQLATQAGLKIGGYNQLKDHRNPKLNTAYKLAKALDVSIDDLIKDDDKADILNENSTEYVKNCSKCKKLEKQIEQQLDHIELLMNECGRKKKTSAG